MKRHTTENARIDRSIPAGMLSMNAQQIVDAVFKAETGKKLGGKTTAGLLMLEATSHAIFSPDDWKAPIYAIAPIDAEGRQADEWAAAAIIWYHGGEPSRSFVGVYSEGYSG